MKELIPVLPQLTMIVFSLVEFGINVYKHGEPKELKFTFWSISEAIFVIGLMYVGGFQFISWAGLTFAIIYAYGIALMLKKTETKYNFVSFLPAAIVAHFIYFWGGFYDNF